MVVYPFCVIITNENAITKLDMITKPENIIYEDSNLHVL